MKEKLEFPEKNYMVKFFWVSAQRDETFYFETKEHAIRFSKLCDVARPEIYELKKIMG